MKIPKEIADKYASMPEGFRSNVDVSELLALLPRPDDEISADFEYFADNREALANQYPDEWLAIINQVVVAHNRDPLKLRREIEDENLHEMMPLVQFAEKTPRNLSL